MEILIEPIFSLKVSVSGLPVIYKCMSQFNLYVFRYGYREYGGLVKSYDITSGPGIVMFILWFWVLYNTMSDFEHLLVINIVITTCIS